MEDSGSAYNIEPDADFRPSELSSIWKRSCSILSSKKSERQIKQETNGRDVSVPFETPAAECEPDPEPDSRLANWKKWLYIHRKQQVSLSNILNRPPECLLMNKNHNNLYVNQQKRLITEASGYEFCDKYRGPPCFWSPVGGAFSEGLRLGLYIPIQKRYDRSRPSAEVNWCPKPTELEYVGVPEIIMKEKGLSEPCFPHPRDNWDMSIYVARKKGSLRQKLDCFQEHDPQSEDLAVVGVKVTRTDESRVVNFELENSTEGSEDEDIYKSTSVKFEPSVREHISVAIDEEIVDSSLNVWVINFEECITNEIYKKSLTIKSLNDCCVRCSWEAILPRFVKSPLPLRQLRIKSKTFYFNKNDVVVLPSSSEKVTFYFESSKAGAFCEKWILHLSNAPDKEECITVVLQSVVSEKPEIEENLRMINSYIESCMRYAIASKTVKEILQRSRPERPQTLPYDWMFFEEQIFLFNNPDLFYESNHVSILKEMYKKVGEGPWDYSVQTLRKKILRKTLQEDITETVNEFTACVYYLMKPKLTHSFTNEKHKTVYELLCCFIDKMEKESDSLKHILNMPSEILTSFDFSHEDFSKANTLTSILSRKSNRKKSSKKIHFPDALPVVQEDSPLLEQTVTSVFSETTLKSDTGKEGDVKRQEYLEALYIKTYHHLCKTIDNIAIVIDSFDAQKKKGALLSLKTNMMCDSYK